MLQTTFTQLKVSGRETVYSLEVDKSKGAATSQWLSKHGTRHKYSRRGESTVFTISSFDLSDLVFWAISSKYPCTCCLELDCDPTRDDGHVNFRCNLTIADYLEWSFSKAESHQQNVNCLEKLFNLPDATN